LTFSKVVLRDVERLWIEDNAPMATITQEKVPNCEIMPSYLRGEWNGLAYFIRFPLYAMEKAITFRITWWNTPA
jgi:hypothetical protein